MPVVRTGPRSAGKLTEAGVWRKCDARFPPQDSLIKFGEGVYFVSCRGAVALMKPLRTAKLLEIMPVPTTFAICERIASVSIKSPCKETEDLCSVVNPSTVKA